MSSVSIYQVLCVENSFCCSYHALTVVVSQSLWNINYLIHTADTLTANEVEMQI